MSKLPDRTFSRVSQHPEQDEDANKVCDDARADVSTSEAKCAARKRVRGVEATHEKDRCFEALPKDTNDLNDTEVPLLGQAMVSKGNVESFFDTAESGVVRERHFDTIGSEVFRESRFATTESGILRASAAGDASRLPPTTCPDAIDFEAEGGQSDNERPGLVDSSSGEDGVAAVPSARQAWGTDDNDGDGEAH